MFIDHDEERVLLAALEEWGLEFQMGMMTEEMGELLVAMAKLRRSDANLKQDSLEEKIREEVADVIVCACELAMSFGHARVQEIVNYKIARLAIRLPKSDLNPTGAAPLQKAPSTTPAK